MRNRRIRNWARVIGLGLIVLGMTGMKPIGKPRPLRAAALRFVFKPYDGAAETVCSHHLVSDASPYDWRVECFDRGRRFAEYTAHVALTQYVREGSNPLSIELLYWLTGTDLPFEVGNTTWFRFAARSPLRDISSSQTVARGTAGLYLEITP